MSKAPTKKTDTKTTTVNAGPTAPAIVEGNAAIDTGANLPTDTVQDTSTVPAIVPVNVDTAATAGTEAVVVVEADTHVGTIVPVVSAEAAAAIGKAPVNLDKPVVVDAIAKGLVYIKEGKTKADAARAMYETIKDEPKEVIIAAFMQGATLTEKGALTYWYNCKRRAAKAAK